MSNMPYPRVGIACNIKTDRETDAQAEFDEPETVKAISAALASGGYEPFVLEASDGFPRKLENEKPDIVFNIAECKSGRSREAQIPAILEYYGVPYTGSDAAALSVALDKALTKRIARGLGVETPDFALIEKGETRPPDGLGYPLLVKPNAEGSSKGIPDACVAEGPEELSGLIRRASREGALLAERYIDGREFTVGILGNGPGARVFEPMEVVFGKQRGNYKVYSYEMKKNFRDYVSYSCPAAIPEAIKTRMTRDAAAVCGALGCRDMARVDFRLGRDGKAYFLEINPLPGLAPGYSDFPMAAGFNGIGYDGLILLILDYALKRYERSRDRT